MPCNIFEVRKCTRLKFSRATRQRAAEGSCLRLWWIKGQPGLYISQHCSKHCTARYRLVQSRLALELPLQLGSDPDQNTCGKMDGCMDGRRDKYMQAWAYAQLVGRTD